MDRADVAYHGTGLVASQLDLPQAPRAVSWTDAARRVRLPMSDDARPHRPARYADLTGFIDAAGGVAPSSRAEMAAATAEVVLQAGRSPGDGARFVALADRVGMETLAALWKDADPVSLPGALWALYLLREWCRTDSAEVIRLWRAGEPYAQPDAAVAGVGDYADVEGVQRAADAILSGLYQGDFDVALERAAALFHVIAVGRRESGSDLELADRNDRAAAALRVAAARWRDGTLH